MDLICCNCGEPWDIDSLHEEAEARASDAPGAKYETVFATVSIEFRRKGCNALAEAFGNQPGCKPVRTLRTAAAEAMYEINGDDLDGAAAMLEDLRL